jgi:hypothetical protein
MANVSRKELKQVPHLNLGDLGDRQINLMPLWDGETWHSWIPTEDKIVRMPMQGLVEGNYLAKAVQTESDLFIRFVDLMWQRASWPEIVPLVIAIEDDFCNMGTSITKLKHIFQTQKLLPQGAPRTFAATELEYLIILCRTVFDLLHEMISRIWNMRVCLLDPDAERRRKSRKLPTDSFARICLKEDSPLTVEEIEQRFRLPKALAEQYVLAAPFFVELRKLRTVVVHGGTELVHIVETERGFCIGKNSPLLRAIPCKFTHEYNEHLVSILPLLSAMIVQTIDTCNSLVNAFARIIPLPGRIAPAYHVFVRGPNTKALLEVLEIHNGGPAWWEFPASSE